MHDFSPHWYQSFSLLMRVPQYIEMTIVKKFTNEHIVKFLWFEKSFSVQLDMVVSIDILQFQPNWCRITACHAILLIGYYAKNGNPKEAWYFAESWIWCTTFFLSANVRTGFYITALLCELSLQWLHREVMCPKISYKCLFLPQQWTEIVFSKPFTKIIQKNVPNAIYGEVGN